MKIISYLDYGTKDTKEDINSFLKLNIDECIISKFNGVLINKLTKQEVTSLSLLIKQNKIKVYALELEKIDFDIYKDDFNLLLEKFQIMVDYAKIVNTRQIILTLPYIEDILNDFSLIEEDLKKLLDLAKINKITIKFKQGLNKNATVVYLLKNLKYKEMELLFTPAQIYLNKESVIVANRLYKHYLNNILIQDLDSVGNPELIGYGKVGLIDLFRRMSRDRFKGDLILDPSFIIYSDESKVKLETKKVSLVKKIFTRKPKTINYLVGFGERIFPGEDRIPTIIEIYESQIKAIKKIFNLR